ncbi:MAG: hypothetical protein IIU78_02160, partial [Alistipes sp.]|nr:hypothetical protein [Alistipes sp.]
NEAKVLEMFTDPNFCSTFCDRLNISSIAEANIGGLHEKNVESILGDTTKSKSDLTLVLENGSHVNISIKKSSAGQVYLISVERFIEGFERQFKTTISDSVKNMLRLYFNGHPRIKEIIEASNTKYKLRPNIAKYQTRKQRLVWESLCTYNNHGANELLNWFKENIGKIAEFCFSKGLSAMDADWADYVWYTNRVGEIALDSIYRVEDICVASQRNQDKVYIGKTLGGTTIQLPFGFVQWHQGQMQFHHNLAKIANIVENI